ncbi:polycomb group protein ASXL1 isoform X1 [Carettochelys insculpta]
MLHSNSRGGDGLFYKLPGRISLFTLKKDALQWSRNLSVPEGEELDDAMDAESCGSNEAGTVSGDNDVSLDETSSNASCSTESQSKCLSTSRESCRTATQTSKQKKKTDVMLPRVVLTPLKVNGAHMESASGFTGRHADGESSSTSSSSSSSSLALCSASMRSRTEVSRDPPQLLRGIRKPAAGQMKRSRGEDIDFETPGSILVNTNLRALINSRTFNALPPHFQQQLLFLLPEVDRQAGADGLMRLSGSALNNEFFTHAAQSWRERLADGEFTHEMQVRIRQEMEKEKRVEQWKEKFFEDYYGQKLGLTREESHQQNSKQEDAENRTELSVQAEAAKPQHGPATRQRDGHFKKRSRPDLRCRARRSLYKVRGPDLTETPKEIASMGPDSSLHKETKAEVDLGGEDLAGSSAASLKAENSELLVSPEASRLHSTMEDLSLAAASVNRIPSLPQENLDRESKDQKRKCIEDAASTSFPEKKPRLEDRQSFRNTIESVHPEKPQPTKEEPKVPPIRIQLSRIKPPWVVKGQPTYQICPRIIPSTESPGRGRTGARTLADIKARALQARAQREATTASIGGGGGPGGGGGNSTDKGGGGGESSSHTEYRRSKRTHGRCASDLQRTQLLPLLHVEGEKSNFAEVAVQVAKINLSESAKQDPYTPNGEGAFILERAAGVLSGGTEDVAQHTDGLVNSQLGDALTGPSFDPSSSLGQEDNFEQLLHDVRTENTPQIPSREGQGNKQDCVVLSENALLCSQGQRSAVNFIDDVTVVPRNEDIGTHIELNCNSPVKETCSSNSSLTTELPSDVKEQHEPEIEMGFNGSSKPRGKCVTDHDSKMNTIGMENMDSELHAFTHLQTGEQHESECQNGEQNKGSLVKPFSLGGLSVQNGIGAPKKLPQLWEGPSGADTENLCQHMKETQRLKTNGDDEIRSTHSETTDTASDSEADLTDENVEVDLCFRDVHLKEAIEKGDASHKHNTEGNEGIRSASSVKTDSLPYTVNLPSVTMASNVSRPQRWALHTPLPQKTSESQKKPPSSTRPLSSIEANNPLVMQLLKGNLSLEKVLPVSHASIKLEITESSLDRPSENHSLQVKRSSSCGFDQESSQDVGINTSDLNRSDDFHSPGTLRDHQKKPSNSRTVLSNIESLENQPDLPEKLSKVGPSLSSPDQMASMVSDSQKPRELGPRERSSSSCRFKDQKELPLVHGIPQHNPLTNTITNENPGKQNPPAAPPFLAPSATSLGTNRIGGASINKTYIGVQDKKLFGSGFSCNTAVRLHHPRDLEDIATMGTASPSKQIPLSKSARSGGVLTAREDWPSKQHANTLGGIKNENILACGGPAKGSVKNRKDVPHSPVELMEHLQSVPFVMDLPFFKLPREPGKGLNQPLEPSSIPSQLNIKQAFYGKLSKLHLNSTGFNYSSNTTSAFPRSLAGSVMQLSHKANFAANHSTSLSVQMFADSNSVEEISLKCSCSLKAMIMCKGCGAFCHDDCIGPSKLCVLCLVVR